MRIPPTDIRLVYKVTKNRFKSIGTRSSCDTADYNLYWTNDSIEGIVEVVVSDNCHTWHITLTAPPSPFTPYFIPRHWLPDKIHWFDYFQRLLCLVWNPISVYSSLFNSQFYYSDFPSLFSFFPPSFFGGWLNDNHSVVYRILQLDNFNWEQPLALSSGQLLISCYQTGLIGSVHCDPKCLPWFNVLEKETNSLPSVIHPYISQFVLHGQHGF